MAMLQWIVEGNSDILILGKSRLAELVSQCSETFFVFILDGCYTINCKDNSVIAIQVECKGDTLVTVEKPNLLGIGSIHLHNANIAYYSFHPTKGLSIYFDTLEIDKIIYNIDGNKQLEVYIDDYLSQLSIEQLLLLISIGKILFQLYKKSRLCNGEYSIINPVFNSHQLQ